MGSHPLPVVETAVGVGPISCQLNQPDNENGNPQLNSDDKSNPLAYEDIEAHVTYEEIFSKSDETGVPTWNENGMVSDHENVPVPKERKACFRFAYGSFLASYLVFFLVIAFTYPLKPVCHIDNFYLPVFDKMSHNITNEMKESVYVKLRFNNRNRLISITYNDILNMSIYYYFPNSDRPIFFANYSIAGFYEHKMKAAYADVWTSAPGMSSLMRLKEEFSRMFFRVDLEFGVRFHCRELGKHKHKFLMTADVEIDWQGTGKSYEDTTEMSENSL